MSIANVVTAQTIDFGVENATTGADGTATIANRGEKMTYVIMVTNNTSSNLTTSTVYGNIPLGGTYVAGSTKVNGISVSDVNGKMPFAGSGGLVNSASSAAGVLAPNSYVIVKFTVAINFAGGSLTNSSSFQAINSSGTIVTLNSNSVSTRVAGDGNCRTIFQSTGTVPTSTPPTYTYRLIQDMDPLTGQASFTYASNLKTPTYNAIEGGRVTTALTDIEAMAIDPSNGRIYFTNGPTNNPAKDLCYYDIPSFGVYRYVGYPLETNTAANYTITAMSFASDGNGYALTENHQDLIRFSVDPSTNIPTITPLGALINDAANGSNDITAETGGDLFADAFGRLYLVTNSAKLYRIDPATRNTVYLGTISGVRAGVNSVAVDYNGYIYISGAYQTVYKVDLSTMTAVAINSGSNGVWTNSDYTSCNMPPFGPVLNISKSYIGTRSNGSYVLSGDPVEYTITISNTGNISAGGVKLSDAIPTYAHYIAGSTTMNGAAVADIGGTMPFAAGSYVNSPATGAGVVMPGDANNVVIKFRVTTDPLKQVCNQASVTYPEINSGTVTINSDDPSKPGGPDATCFWSDGVLCENCCEGCSTVVNNAAVGRIITAKVQPNPFRETINMQVQSNSSQQVSVRLIDFYGRTVYTATQQLGAGYNSFHVDAPANLARGVYVLELSAGNNRLIQKKLIKQ